jgi:hypothetical protein
MRSACDFFDPKSAGIAVARWGLGLLLFYGGPGKLMGGVLEKVINLFGWFL